MPDRIIRDELLTSERYWSCSIQAQQLYVHILLVVDDAARFSGKNFSIRAACFPGRPMEAATLEKMLVELIDADLVRAYESSGERFLFVPRFHNRRRYVASSKYPAPPNEINDLPPEKSAPSQPQVSPKSGGVGVGVGEGKDKEPSARAPKARTSPQAIAKPEGVEQQTWDDWIAHRKAKKTTVTATVVKSAAAEAAKAGITLDAFLAIWCTRGSQGLEAAWLKPDELRGARQANAGALDSLFARGAR